MKRLLYLFVMIFIMVDLVSQDSLMKKNVIAIVPTSLLNRTISLSYYRILKPELEISINTSLRKGPTTGHNIFLDMTFQDPYWYYNRFTTRVGILKYLNGYMVFEPEIKFDFGYFTNQTLIIENKTGDEEDEFWRLNRNYSGLGFVLFWGFCHDYNRFRLKIFGGLNCDLRLYQEKIHEKWIGYSNPFYTNTDNTITYYGKGHFSLKFGIELGFKF